MGARVRARQGQAKPRRNGAVRQDQTPEEWFDDAPTVPLQQPKVTQDEPTQSYQTDTYEEAPYVGWKRGSRFAVPAFADGYTLPSKRMVRQINWFQVSLFGLKAIFVLWLAFGLWQTILMTKTWWMTRPVIHRIEATGKFEAQTVCALADADGPSCPIKQFQPTIRADGSTKRFVLHFVGENGPGKIACMALRVPPELQFEDSTTVYDFFAPLGKTTPCMTDFWVWLKPDFVKEVTVPKH